MQIMVNILILRIHLVLPRKCYYICIYSNALVTNFITETNTMNPDQTVSKETVSKETVSSGLN